MLSTNQHLLSESFLFSLLLSLNFFWALFLFNLEFVVSNNYLFRLVMFIPRFSEMGSGFGSVLRDIFLYLRFKWISYLFYWFLLSRPAWHIFWSILSWNSNWLGVLPSSDPLTRCRFRLGFLMFSSIRFCSPISSRRCVFWIIGGCTSSPGSPGRISFVCASGIELLSYFMGRRFFNFVLVIQNSI